MVMLRFRKQNPRMNEEIEFGFGFGGAEYKNEKQRTKTKKRRKNSKFMEIYILVMNPYPK